MKNQITKKEQAKQTTVSTVKVLIGLTLFVTALNLAGYLGLSATAKLFCAGVCALVGVWSLIKNVR